MPTADVTSSCSLPAQQRQQSLRGNPSASRRMDDESLLNFLSSFPPPPPPPPLALSATTIMPFGGGGGRDLVAILDEALELIYDTTSEMNDPCFRRLLDQQQNVLGPSQ
ncbi:unnamed protein product [Cylindrotheca closterium]|uniref:Uncharacterized protein n=1 Tax=Cylindrotheca closterium TaxID=2856 RepID=A0AAD2G061_9STRA|nr:unnamed protein product [Cylindrotheca closterium]